MHSLAPETDVRAMHAAVEDARLVVNLMDGCTIAVPLAWYPRLANAIRMTTWCLNVLWHQTASIW